jgi:putative flippase GtrA
MRIGKAAFADAAAASLPGPAEDRLRRLAARLPQTVRFLAVGSIGLLTDLAVFSIVVGAGIHPLAARIASLSVATLMTWRLNRALTFDASGRQQGEEALRYAVVTVTAQGTNYVVFAALVITALAEVPRAALLAGAAVGALLSYAGHRMFSFAPRRGEQRTVSVYRCEASR